MNSPKKIGLPKKEWGLEEPVTSCCRPVTEAAKTIMFINARSFFISVLRASGTKNTTGESKERR